MDKEKFLTIGIGLFVGILVAGLYFFLTSYLPALQKSQAKVTFTPSNGTQKPVVNSLSITLSQPEDHSATTGATVTVIGKTLPNIKVILFSNTDTNEVTSDASGNFSIDTNLEPGENEISVTAFDSQNNPVTVKRNITQEIIQ